METLSVLLSLVCLVSVCQAVALSGWTAYDKPFEFMCPQDMTFRRIESTHHNHYEDRRFYFTCDNVPDNLKLEKCQWTDFLNSFDWKIDYNCPGGVVAGMFAIHDNWHEDRRFKFYCCNVRGYRPTGCKATDWANDHDGEMDTTFPDGTVMVGMQSYHSNDREDRIFRFNYCTLSR